MHKLEKLILEQFASIQEKTDINDLPKEFVAAIEKRYGKMHPKDFFSDDKSRYMKFDGENKTTGQVTHKVIPIASFEKMYDDFQDIVDDIKSLMRDKDVRTDKSARELFELIRTNFRKLQRYLRTERPDQYALIRNRAALAELHEMFVKHASLIIEEKKLLKESMLDDLKEDEEETDDYGRPYVDPKGSRTYIDPEDMTPAARAAKMLKEEEPTPEEEPDTDAPEETVLEDATDTILSKFPTLKSAIVRLQTEDFKEFVDSIDWISPRPTEFRINLKNGQEYILKWLGDGFEAQIMGKRYYINKINDYQQALDKLAILYREGPMSGAGEGEPADTDTGGGGGGGGDFPGDDAAGGGGEDLGADDAGAGEEGGADLGGEEIDFEEPAEEPDA